MDYCCDFMKEQLNYKCSKHGKECPDIIIELCSDGTLILRGRNAEYYCDYCPSCGTKWARHIPKS